MANWGNLANRMLSFAYKRFDGHVPEPGDPSSSSGQAPSSSSGQAPSSSSGQAPSSTSGQGFDDADRALLAKADAGFQEVGYLLKACRFRAALGEAMALAREANVYLDRKAPWLQIKEDRAAAATSVYVILRAVDNLKTLFAPFLPHTAQRLHEYLGYDGQLFGRQYVIEVQEETRNHEAVTYNHSGPIVAWTPSQLPSGQTVR